MSNKKMTKDEVRAAAEEWAVLRREPDMVKRLTYKTAAVEFAHVILGIYESAGHCTTCGGEPTMSFRGNVPVPDHPFWDGEHTNPECVCYQANIIINKERS